MITTLRECNDNYMDESVMITMITRVITTWRECNDNESVMITTYGV